MADFMHKNGILPDLPNDITGEQLFLQQKVFRKNEEFIQLNTGIINWLKSDENNRKYPVEFKQNKNSFRKRVEKNIYDEKSKVLYK